MKMIKKNLPIMESYNLSFHIEPTIIKGDSLNKKTGTCKVCGCNTSKKNKGICLSCTTNRLKLKYGTKN